MASILANPLLATQLRYYADDVRERKPRRGRLTKRERNLRKVFLMAALAVEWAQRNIAKEAQ